MVRFYAKEKKVRMTHIEILTHEKKLRSGAYPTLAVAGKLIRKPESEIIGRDTTELREAIRNPEKANVVLIGDPGVGKTTFIQKFAYVDSEDYLIIALNLEALVINKDTSMDIEMAQNLEKVAAEAAQYSKDNDVIVVLFIDEFHRLAQLSEVVVEAFKPVLEKSATEGFRIIGATTLKEYEKWVVPNPPLDQRVLRMNLDEPSRGVVIQVLKSRLRQYGVDEYAEDGICDEIYETAKQYLPMNAQPRASIDLLLDMVGAITTREYMRDGQLHREYGPVGGVPAKGGKWFNHHVLHRVVMRKFHIDIDHHVDLRRLRTRLEDSLMGQQEPIDMVCRALGTSKAGFTDPTKPLLSMMFMGPSGVGKTEMVKIISEELQIPLQRIDLSIFTSVDQVQSFVNLLSYMAWSKPNSIILIDEIDKSINEVMNTMLSVTDDGQLQTGAEGGRVVSFAGNIIIMTTNAGGNVILDAKKNDSTKALDRNEMIKALENDPTFSSANLGRIDELVLFNKLPASIERKIAQIEAQKQFENMQTNTRRIVADEDVFTLVVNQTSAKGSQGAREVKRTLRRLVFASIADHMLHVDDINPIFAYVDGRLKGRDPGVQDQLSGDLVVESCVPLGETEKFKAWLEARMQAKFGKTVTLDFSQFVIPKSLNWQDATHRKRHIEQITRLIEEQGATKIITYRKPQQGSYPAQITFKGVVTDVSNS